MKRIIPLLALVMILCLLPLDGLAVRYGDVVRITNPNAVNVRKGPGTGYGVLGEAQPQNTYVYLGTESGWYRIIYTGETIGYVAGNRTTIEPGLVPDYIGYGDRVEAEVVVTHGNALNVRRGPGTKYGSIGQAKPGSTWTYLGMDDGWNIIDYYGQTGYIAANRTEVVVVDLIAGATENTFCDECGGSGDCMTCESEGKVYNGKLKTYTTCPSCDGTLNCWQCGGSGTY
jgi:uncharacterized protein YraI